MRFFSVRIHGSFLFVNSGSCGIKKEEMMGDFINSAPLFVVILLLVVGFALLVKGADFFVEGSSSVAKKLAVPSIIIGLTIVAMGTSLPETAVSVTASLVDNNTLAISNVVGSNIFNLMFVIGVCSILSTIYVQRETVTRDIPFSIICALLLLGLGMIAVGDATGMTLGHFDGILFLILFAGYIGLMIKSAMKARAEGKEVEANDEFDEEELKVMSYPKSIIYIVGGAIAIAIGGDLTVDTASRIAIDLGMSQTLVGLTIVSIGTSLPELVTSVVAARKNEVDMAVGNAVGSNIFNTLVVLGASALFAPVAVKGNILKRDFPFCIGITAVMIVLLMTLNHGDIALTRLDGIILLALFAVFMVGSVVMGKKESKLIESAEDSEKADLPMWKCLLFIIIGFVGVVVGGQLTVKGAKELALMAGMSERVVGLTVVAIGTSLPELVTSIVAARKQQNDIAVGNVIGSNIFNLLFILGISATIGTIGTDFNVVIDGCVLIGICLFTYIFALANKKINCPCGVIMIFMYVAYTVYLLVR